MSTPVTHLLFNLEVAVEVIADALCDFDPHLTQADALKEADNIIDEIGRQGGIGD